MRLIALVSGIVLSFSLCSIAGHLIPEKLENFTRFHIYISPDSLYYPTVRSVYNAVRAQTTPDKPLVIFGGSSVMYGAGQPEGKTIADYLRKDLGHDYNVVNLAMRGNGVPGMGLFIAQSLKAEGYNVFFIADAFYGAIDLVSESPFYDYIYWQYRSEDFAKAWKPRDDLGKATRFENLPIGQELNQFFRFTNLWTQIGYQYLFTVYSKFANTAFWAPRRTFVDPEYEMPKGIFETRVNVSAEIQSISRVFANAPQDHDWEINQATWVAVIPTELREKTLFVLCKKNPYITKLLNPEQQRLIEALYAETERRFNAVGLHASQACKDLVEDDYADTTHLGVRGAEKMAAELANFIKQSHQAKP